VELFEAHPFTCAVLDPTAGSGLRRDHASASDEGGTSRDAERDCRAGANGDLRLSFCQSLVRPRPRRFAYRVEATGTPDLFLRATESSDASMIDAPSKFGHASAEQQLSEIADDVELHSDRITFLDRFEIPNLLEQSMSTNRCLLENHAGFHDRLNPPRSECSARRTCVPTARCWRSSWRLLASGVSSRTASCLPLNRSGIS